MNKISQTILKLKSLLILWLGIVCFWGIYRYLFRLPEWLDELIVKPWVFIIPPIIYLFKNRQLSLSSLGLNWQKSKLILTWGVGFGLFLVIESVIVSLIKDKQVNYINLHLSALLVNGIISLATAISEEILYRGFLLEQIWQKLHKQLLSNVITTLLFSLGHLSIAVWVLKYQGMELASYLWLIFILGLADGVIYQQTRSVFAPIISHTLWNFSVMWFIG